MKKGSKLIQEHLFEQLRGGIYTPGDKLPSVEVFFSTYAVGRSTIREAFSMLKAMGWLKRATMKFLSQCCT
ncbi:MULTISPECIES: GntR family transcriptional regulator [Paenibacillus]|uniref:GntR family transcriptional regulator n=1 Tax=Paenibacillus TaxID=44249 RepID=UPI002DDD2659|nr:GntR family transcriptional regulator [Paenibacillus alvei]